MDGFDVIVAVTKTGIESEQMGWFIETNGGKSDAVIVNSAGAHGDSDFAIETVLVEHRNQRFEFLATRGAGQEILEGTVVDRADSNAEGGRAIADVFAEPEILTERDSLHAKA